MCTLSVTSARITFPSAESDLLIDAASFNRVPWAPDLDWRFEPACQAYVCVRVCVFSYFRGLWWGRVSTKAQRFFALV